MPSDNVLNLGYCLIVVGKRPFCIWDTELPRHTVEFLESIDASYFEYVANTHLGHIGDGDDAKTKESQHAALILRATFSQALETLFALIAAAIQAPYCPQAWMSLYKTYELHDLIDAIKNYRPLLSQVKHKVLTWRTISDAIYLSLVLEDKEKEQLIKAGFAQLWSHFASDFLDREFTEEYNSIKHGMRVRPGGFYIAIGSQRRQGEPAHPNHMHLLGKSEFGSGYLVPEKIGDTNIHLRMINHHRNWNPEDIAWGLHMVSMSIANIQAALKILNGIPATEVQFSWPNDMDTLLQPWKRSAQLGVTSMSGFNITIPPEYIEAYSKEKILSEYQVGNVVGMRKIEFGQE